MNRKRWIADLFLPVGILVGMGLSGCRLSAVPNQLTAVNVNNHGNTVIVNGRVMDMLPTETLVSGHYEGSGVEAKFDQLVSADRLQALKVIGENGNVRVNASSGSVNRVSVHATRRLEGGRSIAQFQAMLPQLKVTVVVVGGRVTVTSEHPRAWDTQGVSASVDYAITIPARLVVDVADSNGNVSVQGAQHGVAVTTQNGNIELRDVTGAIQAASANGNVNTTLNVSPERAHLSTTNGNLNLRLPQNVSASLSADTTNGTVDVPHATTNEARTSAQATFGGARASIVLTTTNGNVSVEGP